MKKIEYYLNVIGGKDSGEYPRVSGYVESVTGNKNIGILLIGYDERADGCWRATELKTGFCVSRGTFETKRECVKDVHDNIDVIIDIYNLKMTDEKYYQAWIKPFEDFVSANRRRLNNE